MISDRTFTTVPPVGVPTFRTGAPPARPPRKPTSSPPGLHVWVAALEEDNVVVQVISGPGLVRLILPRGLFPEDTQAADTFWVSPPDLQLTPVMTVRRVPPPISPATAAIHARLAQLRDTF